MKLAIVGVAAKNGETGGAEVLFRGLVSAFKDLGVSVEFISPVFDESNFETVMEGYLHFYDLDASQYDGVVSTKAPSYLVRHPNHVCYLIHTMRVFYDMFEQEFRFPSRELLDQRMLIQTLDTAAFRHPRIKKIFTIGNEVKNRLGKFNGLDSTVLHPGLLSNNYKHGSYKYVFLPGRLHRWKRVDLIINAMKYVKSPVELKIAGKGEDEDKLRDLASHDQRIEFLGRVPDEKMTELYSDALCVPFVPIHEDYGYVTIEAYRSGKPVITCVDSGEPSYFVRNGETGFVCDPDPMLIAEKIDYLYQHPDVAQRMGRQGEQSIGYIDWNNVATEILSSLHE